MVRKVLGCSVQIRRSVIIVVALSICAWAFLWRLGSVGLVDETEPLFAEAARQMTVTGDWVTPYFNGETRFDKPPLIYWLMAIAYHMGGINAWTVRLPSALSAIALGGLLFFVLQRFGHLPANPKGHSGQQSASLKRMGASSGGSNWNLAWWGTVLWALNLEAIAWARQGVSDMVLTACIAGSLLCFFVGYAGTEQPIENQLENQLGEGGPASKSFAQNGWYVGFYSLIALAVLTKGPVGIVLPGLIVGAFLLYLGNWRTVLKEMHWLWGGSWILCLTLPWYGLVVRANGMNYVRSFFGYHNLERFTQVVNGHSAPWYFYFGVVLVGFAPWSVFLPLAIARLALWRRRSWQCCPREGHLPLFAAIWFGVILLFFSIAVTKLPSYVLPLIPAAAILVAFLWRDGAHGLPTEGRGGSQAGPSTRLPTGSLHPQEGKGGFLPSVKEWTGGWQVSGWANGILLLVGAVIFLLGPRLLGDDPSMPTLQAALSQSGVPWRGFGLLGGTGAIVLGLVVTGRGQWLGWVNTLGWILALVVLVFPGYTLIDHQRQLPLRSLAEQIIQERRPGEEVVMIGFMKPSLLFYTQSPVTYRHNGRRTYGYLKEWAARSPVPPTLLVLSPPDKIEGMPLRHSQIQVLGTAGAYQLLRISTGSVIAPSSLLTSGSSPPAQLPQ